MDHMSDHLHGQQCFFCSAQRPVRAVRPQPPGPHHHEHYKYGPTGQMLAVEAHREALSEAQDRRLFFCDVCYRHVQMRVAQGTRTDVTEQALSLRAVLRKYAAKKDFEAVTQVADALMRKMGFTAQELGS